MISLLHQAGAYSLVLIALVVSVKLVRFIIRPRNSHLAELKGPPSTNFFFGRHREWIFSEDSGDLVEKWANDYGSVYKLPIGFGKSNIILCDPKAIAHFHARDGHRYLKETFTNKMARSMLGKNMFSAERDEHKRQRRNTTPAFSNAALRGVLHVFYDSTYKLKTSWDLSFESSNEAIINVQDWQVHFTMNRLTLDSIGIAGFGRDFKALEGHRSPILEAFNSLIASHNLAALQVFVLIGHLIPQVFNIPLGPLKQLKGAFSKIAIDLIEESGRREDTSEKTRDSSILGLLLKGESKGESDNGLGLSHDEIVGQGLFVFAGYDTTAISLSWALAELALNQEIQAKLRSELEQFSTTDPTWDQLMSGLPYLDAVVHEALRLHPPIEAIIRVADEDDIVPLTTPATLSSGEIVNAISVSKGTVLTSSITFINRCEAFWGPDAKQFVPERWLKGNPCIANDLSGHKRLYTFSDGPRMCLGRVFALAEFKATLSVLIRNFTFEFPNGPETKMSVYRSALLPRPKLAGATSASLPMRVRQVDR